MDRSWIGRSWVQIPAKPEKFFRIFLGKLRVVTWPKIQLVPSGGWFLITISGKKILVADFSSLANLGSLHRPSSPPPPSWIGTMLLDIGLYMGLYVCWWQFPYKAQPRGLASTGLEVRRESVQSPGRLWAVLAGWFTSIVLWQLQMLKDQMTCLCWLRWADAAVRWVCFIGCPLGGPTVCETNKQTNIQLWLCLAKHSIVKRSMFLWVSWKHGLESSHDGTWHRKTWRRPVGSFGKPLQSSWHQLQSGWPRFWRMWSQHPTSKL